MIRIASWGVRASWISVIPSSCHGTRSFTARITWASSSTISTFMTCSFLLCIPASGSPPGYVWWCQSFHRKESPWNTGFYNSAGDADRRSASRCCLIRTGFPYLPPAAVRSLKQQNCGMAALLKSGLGSRQRLPRQRKPPQFFQLFCRNSGSGIDHEEVKIVAFCIRTDA